MEMLDLTGFKDKVKRLIKREFDDFELMEAVLAAEHVVTMNNFVHGKGVSAEEFTATVAVFMDIQLRIQREPN